MSNNSADENILWLSVFQFIFLRFYLTIQKPNIWATSLGILSSLWVENIHIVRKVYDIIDNVNIVIIIPNSVF